jgi:hypothetical protein
VEYLFALFSLLWQCAQIEPTVGIGIILLTLYATWLLAQILYITGMPIDTTTIDIVLVCVVSVVLLCVRVYMDR